MCACLGWGGLPGRSEKWKGGDTVDRIQGQAEEGEKEPRTFPPPSGKAGKEGEAPGNQGQAGFSAAGSAGPAGDSGRAQLRPHSSGAQRLDPPLRSPATDSGSPLPGDPPQDAGGRGRSRGAHLGAHGGRDRSRGAHLGAHRGRGRSRWAHRRGAHGAVGKGRAGRGQPATLGDAGGTTPPPGPPQMRLRPRRRRRPAPGTGTGVGPPRRRRAPGAPGPPAAWAPRRRPRAPGPPGGGWPRGAPGRTATC